MTEPRPIPFAWPDGLVLDVLLNRLRTETVMGVPRQWRSSTSMVWDVVGGPDGGWVITPHDIVRDVLEHSEALPGVYDHRAAIHLLEDLLPTLHVDAQAQLVAVSDLGWIRDAVLDDQLRAEAPGPVVDVLERLMSESASRQRVSTLWNGLAGLWAGRRLEVGALYELHYEEPMPMLGGQPLGMVCELSCLGDGDELELGAVTRLDEAGVEAIVAALLSGPMRDVTFSADDWQSVVSLRADAKELVPRKMTYQTRRSAVTQGPGGELRWTQAAELQGWEFARRGEVR
jgi:hypothetical protein